MERNNVKEKNIVEQGKGKIKLIYVLNKGIVARNNVGDIISCHYSLIQNIYKGIVARNNVGDIMFFQFGQNITPYLVLPYDYMEADPEYPECTEVYSFFNEGFAFWVSKKDRDVLYKMVCMSSFIFEGYELIGMEYDKFISLKLLYPDYVQYDSEYPGSNINFRHYTIYYFCKYQFVFYVWRGKIRRVYLKDRFFRNKPYYMRNFDVVKYEE